MGNGASIVEAGSRPSTPTPIRRLSRSVRHGSAVLNAMLAETSGWLTKRKELKRLTPKQAKEAEFSPLKHLQEVAAKGYTYSQPDHKRQPVSKRRSVLYAEFDELLRQAAKQGINPTRRDQLDLVRDQLEHQLPYQSRSFSLGDSERDLRRASSLGSVAYKRKSSSAGAAQFPRVSSESTARRVHALSLCHPEPSTETTTLPLLLLPQRSPSPSVQKPSSPPSAKPSPRPSPRHTEAPMAESPLSDAPTEELLAPRPPSAPRGSFPRAQSPRASQLLSAPAPAGEDAAKLPQSATKLPSPPRAAEKEGGGEVGGQGDVVAAPPSNLAPARTMLPPIRLGPRHGAGVKLPALSGISAGA